MKLLFELKKLLRPLPVIAVIVMLAVGAADLWYFSVFKYKPDGIRALAPYQELYKEYKGSVTPEKAANFANLQLSAQTSSGDAAYDVCLGRFLSDYGYYAALASDWRKNSILSERAAEKIRLGIYPTSDAPRFAKLKAQSDKLVSGPGLYFMGTDRLENILSERRFWVIALAAAAVLLCGVFTYDRRSKTEKLLAATRSGIRGLTLSRLCAGCLAAGAVSLLFSALQACFILGQTDTGGLTAAFQSVPLFENSVVHLSVLGYLFASAALRLIGTLLFALIVLAFSAACPHAVWALGASGAALALLTAFTPAASGAFTLSPLTLCAVTPLYVGFHPIILFGHAFEPATLSYMTAFLLSALLFATLLFAINRKRAYRHAV